MTPSEVTILIMIIGAFIAFAATLHGIRGNSKPMRPGSRGRG
jgi:hypothetical protein